jgi:TldD protein
MTHRYTAPFSPRGSAPIDATIAERLLAVALSRGGDYADLFFEYEVSGSYGYEEGILKNAGRGVSLGLGVRVRKGDATGYAYCEDLAIEAMEHHPEWSNVWNRVVIDLTTHDAGGITAKDVLLAEKLESLAKRLV